MKLTELQLKNFRCFENLTVNFPTDYTVLIGINGSGKSAILDSIRIFLDLFASGNRLNQNEHFRGIWAGLEISANDIRLATCLNGSVLESTAQYPTSVLGKIIDNKKNRIVWGRILNGLHNVENNKDFDGSRLVEYLTGIHNQLVNGEEIILPIIAYYGTTRRWMPTEMEKIDNHEIVPPKYSFPRLQGYSNCLSSTIFQFDSMRKWFARMLLVERKKNVPEFQAVKNAITTCYRNINNRKNLSNVLIDYDAEAEDLELQLYFDNGQYEALPLNFLSDGAKSILMIVADIAYRMAVLNPHLLGRVIQETDGIVLIDEIDMHLHPSWQRRIVRSLHETFPKVQFIFTTHSPTVLTGVPKENIKVLNNGAIDTPSINTKGRDVNSILREIMHTDIRPPETQAKLTAFSNAIDEEKFDEAENILNELREELGDKDSEVVGAQVTLDLERL